ncbi:J domain-containing protein [Legionella fallonii]|uniref:J domain-containing protein n=1 Tax=Legionella fallonii LLAP-10 TaxID=1212491 RepID=A0A098FZ99_9GAMM|nr:hypothetical protein [Legionella fallonii]CEG55553.1 conserved protein of unknown function [Heat shock protein DnaJ, N-terminal] [Legionella fallonii LLAP-10]
MPIPYSSIFDGPTIITKNDMCQLLNLDVSRAGLIFSAAEIKKAYHKRALRFHPDAQTRFAPPIPTEICNILMNDIVLARDYLLNGDDNILGKAFVENSESMVVNSGNWVDTVISILDGIKVGTSAVSYTVPWLSRLSNNFLMTLLLSTFANGQLNFRFINTFSAQLAAMRPYLQEIDGSSLAEFLHKIKSGLTATDELDAVAIVAQLKEILPKSLTENEKFDDLIAAIQGTGSELKELLTDDFIDHLQHIVYFWPNFVATIPSWTHITGVYFISLLFTATSLPKFFSATKTITEVIWEQKGAVATILAALPFTLLTALLLPLNIVIQFGIQFAWIAMKASLQVLVNSFKLLFSAFNLIRSVFNEEISFPQQAFALFESILNLTVRLSFNLVFELLDEMIFILSNHSVLSSLQNGFNSLLDSMLDSIRPEIVVHEIEPWSEEQLNAEDQGQLMVAYDHQEQPEEETVANTAAQAFGFFADTNFPLHNAQDLWLIQLLASVAVQQDEVHEHDEQTATPMSRVA